MSTTQYTLDSTLEVAYLAVFGQLNCVIELRGQPFAHAEGALGAATSLPLALADRLLLCLPQLPLHLRRHSAAITSNYGFMQLVYDTSGCSSQGFSWSPSNRYLNRSKLASTRLCNNQQPYYYAILVDIRIQECHSSVTGGCATDSSSLGNVPVELIL